MSSTFPAKRPAKRRPPVSQFSYSFDRVAYMRWRAQCWWLSLRRPVSA